MNIFTVQKIYLTGFDLRQKYIDQRDYKVYQTWAEGLLDVRGLSLITRIIVHATFYNLKLADAVFTFSSVAMYFLFTHPSMVRFCLLPVR